MSISYPIPDQRWVSDSEPDLGLGIILSTTANRVEILFAAVGERRLYALASAPLRRVAFKVGDRIRGHDGVDVVVDNVLEEEGLLTYQAGSTLIPEAELSDTISFSSPRERLLAGSVDPVETFDLRSQALEFVNQISGSSVRGFVGPRIDLIPHQLSIAGEVAPRLVPRVLLADEVGLGKTIEAGLILHRLHRTGRARRVLILVPEPLMHQWFVELYRRFNLPFSIFDEERCESINLNDPEANPFREAQLILCSVELLSGDQRRAAQALEADWDLLIVDEAHHLEWNPSRTSRSYQVVAAFAATTPGLLLLTATPQQLGAEGHFARLRLLDPDRYADLNEFLKEADHYEQVADVIERVQEGVPLTAGELAFVDTHSPRVGQEAREVALGNNAARERLVAELLDSFGTGRVMFRNMRTAISGFPERKAHLVPLDAVNKTQAKVRWLADLLRRLQGQKVLLICRTRTLVEQVHERLQHEMTISAALFHENLTLIQRDRNAAWFADEEGARILISSEIGSEGRNFQFAHHLVLFDLPDDPELLEQRIGRLDRIGQTATIQIYVPYMKGTASEVLAFWYHYGLNAFEQSLHGASEIARAVRGELVPLLAEFDPDRLAVLIERSHQERQYITGRLQRGYDRLLQLNSNRPGKSEEIAQGIRAADSDRSFELFLLQLLDYFGVLVEELADRTYLLRPGHLLTDAFPPLPAEGIGITFDRTRALEREDLGFFTHDHPFVRDVLELFLESEQGNASVAVWNGVDRDELLLEMFVIVETVAPVALNVDRFLPPRPIRVVVDHLLEDHTADQELRAARLRDGDPLRVFDPGMIGRERIPMMIDAALKRAEQVMARIVADASDTMWDTMQREIDRLEDLSQINRNVTAEEIEAMVEH